MRVDEILKNVWSVLGYNNKTAFAKSLGRRVEIIDYAIKKNKVSDILETLITSKHPVNAEYLRTGKGEIIKKVTKYSQSDCPLCKEKERTIAEKERNIRILEERVEELKEYIEELKNPEYAKKRLS